jgi:cytochrome c oxidase cbb3-type subunit 3
MHCYFCHGYSGDAKTVASTYLNPAPRDFSATDPARLSVEQMETVVRRGKPDTAMMGFGVKLDAAEITAVVAFIRASFMSGHDDNTRYHIEANGWLDFSRYAAAFPFVSGKLNIDDVGLTAAQQQGLRLFLATCLTCHEGHSQQQTALQLDARAVSYPRGAYSFNNEMPDAVSAATPYAQHDAAPQIADLTAVEQQGESLFQANCAFCHAADGTGKNWIGSFLEPHPRNLTDAGAMANMTRERLRDVIGNGLKDTTMPAWKSVLTEQQIEAVSAYVMRVFVLRSGLPAGQSGGD